MNRITTEFPISSDLENYSYSVITGKEFIIPNKQSPEKEKFDHSWENLKKDNYLKDGKSFRYRQFRYFYFLPSSQKIVPFASTPYYQPPETNQYAESIDRLFDSMTEEVINNAFLRELIKFDFLQLPVQETMKSTPWLLDIHQVRIVTTEAENGEPTPEGIHHDENDFVCIHLIKRENITGGLNGVYSNNKELLQKCSLMDNLDSIILWDPKVMHGVASIYPKNSKKVAFRDVLLIGFSHAPKLQSPTGNSDLDYKEVKKNIKEYKSAVFAQTEVV